MIERAILAALIAVAVCVGVKELGQHHPIALAAQAMAVTNGCEANGWGDQACAREAGQ